MSYVDKATDTIVDALSARDARRPGEHDISGHDAGTGAAQVRAARAHGGHATSSSPSARSGSIPATSGTTRSNTPKVVGGITPACTRVASALYATCIETVVPVSSPEAAELVKLLENTFRSVNIGLVNEMAIICDRLGVNVWEVIDAAATKPFGFMRFTPGPGIGGHCIPLDPHYLAWKMRTLNYRTRFIDVASEINSQMPDFVVEKVAHALNDVCKSVKGSRIARHRRRLQEEHRRHPRESRARCHPTTRGARRRRRLSRSLHPRVHRGWPDASWGRAQRRGTWQE